MKPQASESCVEYIVGEDDNDADIKCDGEKSDYSSSSESDDEDRTFSKSADLSPNDPESDGSSSSGNSSDSSSSPPSKAAPTPNPNNASMCSMCGRGPFKSVKVHLLHCSGVKVKYQCFLCKKVFLNETTLDEHFMHLYSCNVCGQVFSQQNLYTCHQCPKGRKIPVALFCSEFMPKACNICKSFFTSEKTLLDHVTRVHASVVSTKVRIIPKSSLLTDEKVIPLIHSTEVLSSISSPNAVNHAINGKLHVGQTYAGSTVVKSSSPSPQPSAPSANARTAAVPVKSVAVGQPANQASSRSAAPLFVSPVATDTPRDAQASDPDSPTTPTILAMFEHGSRDAAPAKRANTGWRSKASYPCRQCGAVLRQPSLIISHRYLHRGRRSHRCQCGRAFKHRLHLLRHCVQHAEAISYICVSCGDTFTGAKLLAQHLNGKSRGKSSSGHTWKSAVKTKCRMPFICDCGQLFFRPSAYIWHQIKNRTEKCKQLRKAMK
ncbi:zinc finger protein 883 [Mugil cephalus]|uniref:zinc finger protein 883 n=1 Tax=Mugil cephalus TaxID=48193 RepID=UPI001FB59893|nr:zinc finger protein 883 [Mugil cephalus]XP_047454690.1 zinc finger protein 883 [Mugil cephalus]